jgi:hypothetical protein
MSYCRWSSDDYRSDLYVYEAEDSFHIHVANCRYVFDRTKIPSPTVIPVTEAGWAAAAMARQQSIHLLLDDAETEKITLPHAGETFYCDTAGEAADKVAELEALGYYVPAGVIEALREED